MGKIVKLHKIIPVHWVCTAIQLSKFTVSLVGTKIENCDIKFLIPTFSPPYL